MILPGFRFRLIVLLLSVLALFSGFHSVGAQNLIPVTLNSPTHRTASSVTLTWDQTATADSEFHCYKVLYSTEAGADLSEAIFKQEPVPALGTAGILLGILGFSLLFFLFRRRKIVPISLVLVFFTFLVWVRGEAETRVTDCLSSKSITSFTVTGLTPGTEYYFRVLVFGTGGNSVLSNEVSEETLSAASTLNLFDRATFGTAVFE
jgi:hypothetical protein